MHALGTFEESLVSGCLCLHVYFGKERNTSFQFLIHHVDLRLSSPPPFSYIFDVHAISSH